MALVGRRQPSWACVGLRWVSWTCVGLRWSEGGGRGSVKRGVWWWQTCSCRLRLLIIKLTRELKKTYQGARDASRAPSGVLLIVVVVAVVVVIVVVVVVVVQWCDVAVVGDDK